MTIKPESVYFLRCLSLFSGITALAMIFPLILAVVFKEANMIFAFALPSLIVLFIVFLITILTRKTKADIDSSKCLLLVSLTWFMSCLLGAFPFYLCGHGIRFSDAFFESASGFSTTGATIFSDIESLPSTLLFWRSMTQWLGGMGMVVLIVAMLPLIGASGFQLFRGEAPGPDKGRVTPRITATAKILWLIYFTLSVMQTLLLIISGLNWFDAVITTFSTMATGGFLNKNDSVAAFNSPAAEWICIVFMIIAGFNFNLICRLFMRKGKEILKNSEARAYAGIIFFAAITCALVILPMFGSFEKSLRASLFHCVSLLTTTGFTVADHRLWHPLAQGVLFLLMFIGGCSSSTGGGIKVIRHVILFKQSRNELRKQLNPSGVFSIQINGKEGQKDIVHGVAGFIFLYFILVLIAAIFVSISGVDVFSSLNIGLLMTGNIGLGIVSGSMESILFNLPAFTKWVLSFIMLAGRLELWTIFAILYSVRDRLT